MVNKDPREAAIDWIYQRAEDAAAIDVPIEDALQAVRDGYSSIEADRAIAADP
jgi:hypothetical protein